MKSTGVTQPGTGSAPHTPVPGWGSRFPWLRAGTTRRLRGADGAWRAAGSSLSGRWPDVRDSEGEPDASGARSDPGIPALHDMLVVTAGGRWRSVVRSIQVHGPVTRIHAGAHAGAQVVGEGDGHVTRVPGVLLTATVADCVPVFIADRVQKAVGLLHAGWRGRRRGSSSRGSPRCVRPSAAVRPAWPYTSGPPSAGNATKWGPKSSGHSKSRCLRHPAPSTSGRSSRDGLSGRCPRRPGYREQRMHAVRRRRVLFAPAR